MPPGKLDFKSLPGDRRWELYDRCDGNPSKAEDFSDIQRSLENETDFSVGETGLLLDSAFGKKLNRLINSKEGEAAAIKATEMGLPAMAHVEPLVLAKFGLGYRKRKEANVQAGTILANMMEKRLKYVRLRNDAPMPEGSLAKTAILFKPKK